MFEIVGEGPVQVSLSQYISERRLIVTIAEDQQKLTDAGLTIDQKFGLRLDLSDEWDDSELVQPLSTILEFINVLSKSIGDQTLTFVATAITVSV